MNIETLLSTVTNTIDVPSDPDWYDTAVLLSELATLNARIARYLTAALDADAKRSKAVSPSQEAALARQLLELGQRLQARAQAACGEPLELGSS